MVFAFFCASLILGRVMLKTPSANAVFTLSSSIWTGKDIERRKAPRARSRRYPRAEMGAVG